MLTYLDAEDKDETKHLWHMCFPEDSESLSSIIIKEKTKDNEILVKKDNGLLISMVQYNPYAVKLRGRLWKLDYLVGVATEEKPPPPRGTFPGRICENAFTTRRQPESRSRIWFRSTRLCMRRWDLPSSEMWHSMS